MTTDRCEVCDSRNKVRMDVDCLMSLCEDCQISIDLAAYDMSLGIPGAWNPENLRVVIGR